jgi:cytochrome bd ubiquinol oxidase subunit II
MFALHGATYLTLRTAGDLRERASRTAQQLAVPAIILGIGVAAWTVLVAHDNNDRAILPTSVPALLTAIVLVLALGLTRTDRGGWAFAATGLGAIGFIATIFTGLYPRVLVSDPTFANSLTIANAATGHYALQVITVAAAIFTPLILLYQGWSYYVFRKRLGGDDAASYGSLGAGRR